MKKRLAIVVTHPIQYYAPVFKLLAERGNIELKVFYTWGEEGIKPKYDPGFGKTIEWDIPLLEGYDYEFLNNTAKKPGSHHFKGIQNPKIIERIAVFQPTAILVYGWSYSAHLKVLRHFKGKVPVWFRGDSNLIDQQKGWKQIARRFFLSWVYRHIDKAFYVGSANKAYYLEYGLKEKQLIFAPHAIENSRFEKSREAEALELRAKLGLEIENILVLFAGKLEPKKDPELLLKAFIKSNLNRVHLLFVGNGVLEKKLKLAVEGIPPQISNLKSQISFLPFQNQQTMPVVYQACDLLCLPSKGPGETWGLAVNEAMASGKAILVSDKVGCATDLVKQNGLIFQSGNLKSLSDAFKVICADKASLKKRGDLSMRLIKEWSFLKQAEAIENAG